MAVEDVAGDLGAEGVGQAAQVVQEIDSVKAEALLDRISVRQQEIARSVSLGAGGGERAINLRLAD